MVNRNSALAEALKLAAPWLQSFQGKTTCPSAEETAEFIDRVTQQIMTTGNKEG